MLRTPAACQRRRTNLSEARAIGAQDQWHCAAFLPGELTLSAEEETEAMLAAEPKQKQEKGKPPRR